MHSGSSRHASPSASLPTMPSRSIPRPWSPARISSSSTPCSACSPASRPALPSPSRWRGEGGVTSLRALPADVRQADHLVVRHLVDQVLVHGVDLILVVERHPVRLLHHHLLGLAVQLLALLRVEGDA